VLRKDYSGLQPKNVLFFFSLLKTTVIKYLLFAYRYQKTKSLIQYNLGTDLRHLLYVSGISS